MANQVAKTPDDWWKHYNEKTQGYMNEIESRAPFSFDVNSDALYQQYKDQYVQQGKMAMMDTMGQAAAMTGGYGNSYAQTVGQQAYNQQLNQLNNVVPELYGMAYDKWAKEGQDLYNKYELFAGARDSVKANMDAEKGNLINLITSVGYDPTKEELDAAGMTDKQVKAYKGAYEASLTPTYRTISSTEAKDWNEMFKGAKTTDEVNRVERQMVDAGIDPEIAARWKTDYTGLTDEKKEEIKMQLYNYLNNPNLSSGFNPERYIATLPTKFLQDYAREVLEVIKS